MMDLKRREEIEERWGIEGEKDHCCCCSQIAEEDVQECLKEIDELKLEHEKYADAMFWGEIPTLLHRGKR